MPRLGRPSTPCCTETPGFGERSRRERSVYRTPSITPPPSAVITSNSQQLHVPPRTYPHLPPTKRAAHGDGGIPDSRPHDGQVCIRDGTVPTTLAPLSSTPAPRRLVVFF